MFKDVLSLKESIRFHNYKGLYDCSKLFYKRKLIYKRKSNYAIVKL